MLSDIVANARLCTGLILAAMSLIPATASAASQVTCVGDSITFGAGTSNATTESYPAQLQGLLGTTYSVENDGHSGATLLTTGDLPYNSTAEYTRSTATALAMGGDVVIQLGTNDTKSQNWAHKGTFESDCEALVAHYLTPGDAGVAPRVWVNLPPPVFATNPYGIDSMIMTNETIPLLKQCAAAKGVSTIDVYTALQAFGADFADGVHPNDEGAGKIAQAVHDALVKLPTISLSATAASYAPNDPVVVNSTATAAYGTVQSVEVFEGTTSVGKATTSPFTVSITGLATGTHALTGRVTETGGRTADSSPPIQVIVTAAGTTGGSGVSTTPSGSSSAPNGSASSTPSTASSTPASTHSGGCNVARGEGLAGIGVIVGLLVFLQRKLKSKK